MSPPRMRTPAWRLSPAARRVRLALVMNAVDPSITATLACSAAPFSGRSSVGHRSRWTMSPASFFAGVPLETWVVLWVFGQYRHLNAASRGSDQCLAKVVVHVQGVGDQENLPCCLPDPLEQNLLGATSRVPTTPALDRPGLAATQAVRAWCHRLAVRVPCRTCRVSASPQSSGGRGRCFCSGLAMRPASA